jgi:DNA-binding NtrC family response regulator
VELRAIEGELRIEVRSTAEGALQALDEQPVDLVLTDMVLPGMDGLDLVSAIQGIDPNMPVLVVTRLGNVQNAVEAMRRGAYDYVLKPVNASDLGMRLHRAVRMSEILRHKSAFERIIRHELRDGTLVGASAAFQRIVQQIQEAARVRSTVLITGETGTGKGMIARAIHEHSRERERLFQVIDCTTIPEGMVESELFGHVRGAFTGAVADKPGLIELANGGSVFLDEIGDLPLPLQTKLLHVLEDNEVRPVGGTRSKRVQMRFITATNQDLEDKVRSGQFRKDLFYRLAVVRIHVPPLCERSEDIPVLARHLISRLGKEMGKPRCALDASAMSALVAYAWPGNVRELRNVIERAVMLAASDAITAREIQALLPSETQGQSDEDFGAYASLPYMEAKQRVLDQFTRSYLKAKLAMHGNHITKAAEDSGIPRQHFSLLLKRHFGTGDSGNT